jgi:peptidoglycan/xylan/chitin deacetylase (PgdA/CDA1 family)
MIERSKSESTLHNAPTRRISLTFDDGPNEATTPRLLDYLKEAEIRATFFVVGQNVENARGFAIVERIAAEGHQIGNHSYSHARLTQLGAAQIEQEIKKTETLIGSLDKGIKLFRPPFGFHNAVVDRTVEALGYKLVLWNVSSLDWRARYQNRRWVSHVLRQIAARRNSVILAHDVFPSTVEHVPELVAATRKLPETEFVQPTQTQFLS